MLTSAVVTALALTSPGLRGGQENVFGRTDTQKEIELGRQGYEQMLRENYVSQNEQYVRRVGRIFNQLHAALPEKLFPYQYAVIADNDVNACCFPGGFIIVNEGLLAVMPDDDEVAFVLAHELGHGARRHYMREMKKMQSVVAIDFALSTLLGINTGNSSALAGISFTREHEGEADAFGTELYLRAGFDPKDISNGIRVLQRLDGGSDRIPEYLRTHPSHDKRIAAIEERSKTLLESGLVPNSEADVKLHLTDVFGVLPTVAPQPSRWNPHSPGAYWKYAVSSLEGGTSTYEIKAVGVAEIGAAAVWRMELIMSGVAHNYQLTTDGDRVWRRNTPNNPKSQWILESSLLPSGESEGSGDRAFAGMPAEDVTTPAGTFTQCVKIRHQDKKRLFTAWFAPGIGLVKRVNEASGTTETLVEYRHP